MVLDLILIGLGITLQPVPAMAFILLLSAERGVRKGLAFVLAWLGCIVLVLAMVVLATGGQPLAHNSNPSTVVLAVKLALGLGLVLYGEHRRRRLGRPRKPPAWTARLNSVSPWTAAGLAVLLQPWPLVAAGCATAVDADLSHLSTYLVLFGFCLLATATQLVMLVYAVFRPAAAQQRLGRMRTWMADHQDQTIVVICLLLGLWLVGKSISQLV
ncbi:GAP family protein [Kitasatospora sp. NBC_01287]|uniref:GAP family protein n=1 Tax=Kitasatospora sp. NBC_01287 TaxID=2903573 RepID=UPI00225332F5|nr:GAP family protein [Kitasatospora sp. NBC_01287]MCX4751528.1 GAP family protein [Kitasatospora sp. NBC_01287]